MSLEDRRVCPECLRVYIPTPSRPVPYCSEQCRTVAGRQYRRLMHKEPRYNGTQQSGRR